MQLEHPLLNETSHIVSWLAIPKEGSIVTKLILNVFETHAAIASDDCSVARNSTNYGWVVVLVKILRD